MFKTRAIGGGTFLIGALACAVVLAQDATTTMKSEAVDRVNEYSGRLKTALESAIEKGGSLGAVEVCHDAAPKIAADLSSRDGWTISRTSLKPRNANSAPDEYERTVLQTFEAQIAQGEKAASLTSAAVVEGADGKWFRFIKAIPTGPVCLTCHGAEIDPDLKRKIATLYPNDTATGFKLGDMRGAFTLKKQMK